MGDTRLWELLEQLNLRDLVAVGGLEAKVQHYYDDYDADNYDDVSSSQPLMGYTVEDQDNDSIAMMIIPTCSVRIHSGQTVTQVEDHVNDSNGDYRGNIIHSGG